MKNFPFYYIAFGSEDGCDGWKCSSWYVPNCNGWAQTTQTLLGSILTGCVLRGVERGHDISAVILKATEQDFWF